MKTTLPLPTESKKLSWTADFKKQLGLPFVEAKHLRLSEVDVKYIENVIQSNPLYRSLYKQGYTLDDKETPEILQRCKAEIAFLTPFMNDAKCPKSVKNFLYMYIGGMRNWLNEFYNHTQRAREQFFMESWLEKCH